MINGSTGRTAPAAWRSLGAERRGVQGRRPAGPAGWTAARRAGDRSAGAGRAVRGGGPIRGAVGAKHQPPVEGARCGVGRAARGLRGGTRVRQTGAGGNAAGRRLWAAARAAR